MLLIFIILLFSKILICNADEIENVNLKDVIEWTKELSDQLNFLANSYSCIEQIQDNYEIKSKIFTIKPHETLKNTVDGIDKLFNSKNKILHNLVEDAQNHARTYSDEVTERRKNNLKQKFRKNNELVNSTDLPVLNYLTTTEKINLFKTSNKNFTEDNIKNELIKNNLIDKEVEKQLEKSSLENEKNEQSFFEDEFEDFFLNEDENIQSQIENDKKINETLNKAIEHLYSNYTLTTSRTEIDFKENNQDIEIKNKSIENNEILSNDVNNANEIINDTFEKEKTEIEEAKNKNESDTDKKIIENVVNKENEIEDENDFFYFLDVKKIYDPRKPLSNTSIPRLIPEEDEFEQLDEEKKILFKKRWRTWASMKTIKHGLFPNYRLNFSNSGLHIPLNVYPQHENIKHAIKWSERLDKTFKENRKIDPYLNFQFFCSNDGFLRIFPLLEWRVPEFFSNNENFISNEKLEEEFNKPDFNLENINEDISDSDVDDNDPSRALDLYDCRLRDWYVKAAAAPKDVMIMMDSSGSMRGERSIIGQNVLINILDTLTENDYVSIVRFNDQIHSIDECFNTSFVQANKRNVAKFKDKILELGHEENLEKSELVANYTFNIEKGFEMLKNQNEGSNCNKIMMLVTDGDLDNLDDLFKNINKDKSIRVFTYLIGREVTSSLNTESIACKNSGYFTHLKDLAEVKEEVQLYVPILSRPIGLHYYDPNSTLVTTFSSIYADPILPPLTDMVWLKFENKVFEKYKFKQDLDKIEPELMITMSMPVFNLTNGTQTSWDLIGVVGIDVPIREILNEVPFYRLGVNSHVFIINNNGFLIYHPDMRPVYKGLLKRFYVSLDVLEVELIDDNEKARVENKRLLEIRKSMIDGKTDCSELENKFHYDYMTRVFTRKHLICWRPIPNTLLSIAISVPSTYGPYSIETSFEIKKNVNYNHFFELENSEWFVHPAWNYCWDNLFNPYINRDEKELKILLEMTPEEKIKHFLKMNEFNSSSFTLQDYLFNEENEYINSQFFCNEELLSELLFDANATKINLETCSKETKKNSLKIVPLNAFISTRSGLTRFYNFNYENITEEFKRKLSIDENVYKKAVDYSIKYESNHFIWQIEKLNDKKYLTTSKALFLSMKERKKKNEKKREKNFKIKTPFAIVGMQFDYTKLLKLIKKPNFSNLSLKSYILDDNGYFIFGYDENNQLIYDSTNEKSGLLFSEYDNEIFEFLVENLKVYRKIEIFDYQGICEQSKNNDETENNFSLNIQPTIISFIPKTILYLTKELIFFLSFILSDLFIKPINSFQEESSGEDFYYISPPPNRTKIESCRKDFIFYQLNQKINSLNEPKLINLTRKNDNFDSFIIQKIPKTNLLIIITNTEYELVKKSNLPNIIIEGTDCEHHEAFYRIRPFMYKKPMCYPNKEEDNIQVCGSTSNSNLKKFDFYLSIISILIVLIFHCL